MADPALGLDRASDEIFHARRLGALLEIIGDHTSAPEPLFVLDAGGEGRLARAVARCGHRVDAIGASAAAIESPWLYDVVYAIDVMFHILDDGEWAAAVENLASLVRYGGTLIITDENSPHRTPRGRDVVHRTRGEYTALLTPRGLTYRGFRPYAFRVSQVGFHVFTRTR